MDFTKNQKMEEKASESKKKRRSITRKQSSANLKSSSLRSAAMNSYDLEVNGKENDEAYLSPVNHKNKGESAIDESTETLVIASMKRQENKTRQAEESFSIYLSERQQSSIYVSNVRNLVRPSDESEHRLLLESDLSDADVSESEFRDSSFKIISECSSPESSFPSTTVCQLAAIPKSVLLQRRSRKGPTFLDISECKCVEPPTLRSAPPSVVRFDHFLPGQSPPVSGARSECESPLMSHIMCGESESKLPLLPQSSGDSTPRSDGSSTQLISYSSDEFLIR